MASSHHPSELLGLEAFVVGGSAPLSPPLSSSFSQLAFGQSGVEQPDKEKR